MSDQFPNDPSDSKRPPPAENWERAALERIALAAITEQRAARRWRIFFRFVALGLAALVVWGLFDFTGEKVSKTTRHTALVELEGEIAANSNASADNINAALQSAFEDDATAGVILRVNSPGGSPVQAGIIYREIRRLRAKYPSKPLYVVVDDMCASGGYYVAAAADKIYVDKASIVGSIGVLMDGFGFTGLMDKLGIQRRIHTSGENKGAFDPFSPETPQMTAHAQEMLDQIHTQFIDAVKQGRGARLQKRSGVVHRHVLDGRKGCGARSRRRLRRRRLRRARGDQAAGYRRLHAEGEHRRARGAQVRRGGGQCRRSHDDAQRENAVAVNFRG